MGGRPCAHLVVVNAQLDAPTVFRATLGGDAFGDSSFANLTAARMFVTGPTLIAPLANGTISDCIGPGATSIYRIGNCIAPAMPGNLATPPISLSCDDNHSKPSSGCATVAVTVWSARGIFTPQDDTRLSMITDTAVAVAPSSRHSLRVNLPSGTAFVIALPGKQLVPPSTSSWCDAAWHCKTAQVGQHVVPCIIAGACVAV